MAIDCLVLGAGQEVGKSCVVATICGKRVMFDCGMHMGYEDHRRYLDFSRVLAATGAPDFTTAISCVVITHFHQDHIGALPYFTEVCGHHGPIYMTVLGAAMIYAKVGDAAMVYTGDYNMTPDRHLGAAQIDHLKLDLLITESTYAKTICDSRRAREREFLKAAEEETKVWELAGAKGISSLYAQLLGV